MPQSVVLVTGASSGIGKSIGEYLAKQNYKVYGTSRNPKQDHLNGIHFLSLDVTSTESIKALVKQLIALEGQIDVLINNAGVGITGPVEEIPDQETFNVFNTNYFGPVKLINAVLPFMRSKNKGYIINITSIAGYMGLPFRGHYSASKGALTSITEAYRLELRNTNIQLTTIAPGDFATNIAAGRYHAPAKTDSFYNKNYQQSLDLMDQHVDHGSNPDEMALKVHQILSKPSPKIHYKVGSFLQRISPFLKAILSDKTYENLLANHYKL